MIARFRDGQGLPGPIDGGVGGTEPEESKDDVFLATAHDGEEMLLGNPFDVHVQGTSVTDCACFVRHLVNVVNGDEESKLFSGESVFSDKLPVNAGDIGTRVYQCRGINDFKGMQGGDQLYRDMHRFVQSGYKYRSTHY